MTDILDTIKVYQTDYRVSVHAKVRMTERQATIDEVRQTLEDGSCRGQAHGTDICEKDFWIEELQVWKELKVIVDRNVKEIVTVIVNQHP